MRKELEELYKLLKTFDAALMTTVTRDGHLVSRPMALQKQALPDSDLWFVAELDSEKVADLRADPRVNLACFHETGDRSYISVAGTARIDTDRQRMQELWQPDWRIYFPEGPEATDLCLIHVTIDLATYWEPDGGRLSTLYKMAKAYVTGSEPEFKEPVKVDVRDGR